MDVRTIQSRLKQLGFNPGPIDGAYGRLTIEAVKNFQRVNNLQVDGLVGPKTIAALNARTPEAKPVTYDGEPPWLVEARRHIGLREIAGPRHNSTILEWLRRLGAGWADDETAWCGAFVGNCIAVTMPKEVMPTNPFGARNWLKFGVEHRGTVGSIMVFSRPGSSWQGHVGFAVGQDSDSYHILGGNQSNSVNITRISKSRFLGARWPQGYPMPATLLPNRTLAGSLSANEA